MLSTQSFSEFFTDVATFNSLKESLNESLDILHGIKSDTIAQKDQLATKQETEAEMRRIQELQKKEIERKEREKEQILTVTKGEEEVYQQLLESQQKTAAQLRSQLFDLLGGGGGIPFPDAVALAKYASQQTGVEAGLILAILEQETNLGSNLGSCIYNDIRGGKEVMHPDRDAPVFVAIAGILGFDARSKQVSCPIVSNGERYGWGGAMGPSQFIPSTWLMYKDKIKNMTGLAPDPWNIKNAFLATGVYLKDLGVQSNEFKAVMRYFSGSSWSKWEEFYGNSVLAIAKQYEQDIKGMQ